jgi:hypothetical protein
MVVMSSTTVPYRGSIQSIRHKIKNRNLILALRSLINVSNISSMMLIVMDLHGGCINVGFEAFKGVEKVRDGVSVGCDGGSYSSSECYSLLEEITAAGSGILIERGKNGMEWNRIQLVQSVVSFINNPRRLFCFDSF